MSERVYEIPVIPLDWKPWFAWYPVTLTGTKSHVWLKTIERRSVWFIFWTHEYRLAALSLKEPT